MRLGVGRDHPATLQDLQAPGGRQRPGSRAHPGISGRHASGASDRATSDGQMLAVAARASSKVKMARAMASSSDISAMCWCGAVPWKRRVAAHHVHACPSTGNEPMTDPHDLERFLRAQEDSYAPALAELRSGRKRSHWMWFVFPQLAGLGRSEMALRYGIRDADEARAYLRHPLLGARLLECGNAALGIDGSSAEEVFGSPDDLKLRSSATLFASVSPDASVFHRLLDRYFEGRGDERTIAMLQRAAGE